MRRISCYVTVFGLAGIFTAVQPAFSQVDTSMYPRPYQQPSPFDTVRQIQEIQLQRQQLELQKMQIQEQRMRMQPLEEQHQLDFERQQAELYRRRHANDPKPKN